MAAVLTPSYDTHVPLVPLTWRFEQTINEWFQSWIVIYFWRRRKKVSTYRRWRLKEDVLWENRTLFRDSVVLVRENLFRDKPVSVHGNLVLFLDNFGWDLDLWRPSRDNEVWDLDKLLSLWYKMAAFLELSKPSPHDKLCDLEKSFAPKSFADTLVEFREAVSTFDNN